MTRQTELDRQWHETGYEEMGIGFNHEPTEQQDMLTCEDYDPEEYDPGHDLDAAKGMVNDCIIGLIMWTGIIWLAWLIAKWFA